MFSKKHKKKILDELSQKKKFIEKFSGDITKKNRKIFQVIFYEN